MRRAHMFGPSSEPRGRLKIDTSHDASMYFNLPKKISLLKRIYEFHLITKAAWLKRHQVNVISLWDQIRISQWKQKELNIIFFGFFWFLNLEIMTVKNHFVITEHQRKSNIWIWLAAPADIKLMLSPFGTDSQTYLRRKMCRPTTVGIWNAACWLHKTTSVKNWHEAELELNFTAHKQGV